MNCPKCNAPLEGTEAFCSSCGAFLAQEAPMEPTVAPTTNTSQSINMDPPWQTGQGSIDEPVYTRPQVNTSPSYTPVCAEMDTTPKTPYQEGVVPDEVKKWNWGAFFFNAMWGVGNYSYLPLLCLIPLFNFIWMFVCGVKGNEWAWRSGKFDNLEDFLATQQTWNRAGLGAFIFTLVIFVLYLLIFAGTFAMLSSSYYY
ncbi:MAG: zinc ribbon domain-containing protein [Niameybacter sp.]|uniref:zinc ribbon domain-containing protein n=1 Tax=Niameybacter sp. TaxID=2033640 RepID=UPI002FC7B821